MRAEQGVSLHSRISSISKYPVLIIALFLFLTSVLVFAIADSESTPDSCPFDSEFARTQLCEEVQDQVCPFESEYARQTLCPELFQEEDRRTTVRISTASEPVTQVPIKISSAVVEEIREQPRVKVIVTLKKPVVARISSASTTSSADYELEARTMQGRVKARTAGDISIDGSIARENLNAFAAKVDAAALESLLENHEVESVSLNYPISASLSDDLALSTINASEVVANVSTNGSAIRGENMTVCVLDTGINYNHSSLASNGSFPNTKILGGYDFINNDTDPWDDNGHGTHVAGIVAANGSFPGGVVGVAPDAKIIVAKVLDQNGGGDLFTLAQGVDYCWQNTSAITDPNFRGIDAIVMSLGTNASQSSLVCPNILPSTTVTNDALDNAYAQGIMIFGAAGNDNVSNQTSYPGCQGNVTTVGATGLGRGYVINEIADFSNRDAALRVWGPGDQIISTAIEQNDCTGSLANCVYYTDSGNQSGWVAASGTSQATPLVAGGALLIKQFEQLFDARNITPDEMEDYIQFTGLEYINGVTNASIIDVLAAIKQLNGTGMGGGGSPSTVITPPTGQEWPAVVVAMPGAGTVPNSGRNLVNNLRIPGNNATVEVYATSTQNSTGDIAHNNTITLWCDAAVVANYTNVTDSCATGTCDDYNTTQCGGQDVSYFINTSSKQIELVWHKSITDVTLDMSFGDENITDTTNRTDNITIDGDDDFLGEGWANDNPTSGFGTVRMVIVGSAAGGGSPITVVPGVGEEYFAFAGTMPGVFIPTSAPNEINSYKVLGDNATLGIALASGQNGSGNSTYNNSIVVWCDASGITTLANYSNATDTCVTGTCDGPGQSTCGDEQVDYYINTTSKYAEVVWQKNVSLITLDNVTGNEIATDANNETTNITVDAIALVVAPEGYENDNSTSGFGYMRRVLVLDMAGGGGNGSNSSNSSNISSSVSPPAGESWPAWIVRQPTITNATNEYGINRFASNATLSTFATGIITDAGHMDLDLNNTLGVECTEGGNETIIAMFNKSSTTCLFGTCGAVNTSTCDGSQITYVINVSTDTVEVVWHVNASDLFYDENPGDSVFTRPAGNTPTLEVDGQALEGGYEDEPGTGDTNVNTSRTFLGDPVPPQGAHGPPDGLDFVLAFGLEQPVGQTNVSQFYVPATNNWQIQLITDKNSSWGLANGQDVLQVSCVDNASFVHWTAFYNVTSQTCHRGLNVSDANAQGTDAQACDQANFDFCDSEPVSYFIKTTGPLDDGFRRGVEVVWEKVTDQLSLENVTDPNNDDLTRPNILLPDFDTVTFDIILDGKFQENYKESNSSSLDNLTKAYRVLLKTFFVDSVSGTRMLELDQDGWDFDAVNPTSDTFNMDLQYVVEPNSGGKQVLVVNQNAYRGINITQFGVPFSSVVDLSALGGFGLPYNITPQINRTYVFKTIPENNSVKIEITNIDNASSPRKITFNYVMSLTDEDNLSFALDLQDDDNDGFTNNEEERCKTDPFNPQSNCEAAGGIEVSGPLCNNFIDDDEDGFVDCADPGCFNDAFCQGGSGGTGGGGEFTGGAGGQDLLAAGIDRLNNATNTFNYMIIPAFDGSQVELIASVNDSDSPVNATNVLGIVCDDNVGRTWVARYNFTSPTTGTCTQGSCNSKNFTPCGGFNLRYVLNTTKPDVSSIEIIWERSAFDIAYGHNETAANITFPEFFAPFGITLDGNFEPEYQTQAAYFEDTNVDSRYKVKLGSNEEQFGGPGDFDCGGSASISGQINLPGGANQTVYQNIQVHVFQQFEFHDPSTDGAGGGAGGGGFDFTDTDFDGAPDFMETLCLPYEINTLTGLPYNSTEANSAVNDANVFPIDSDFDGIPDCGIAEINDTTGFGDDDDDNDGQPDIDEFYCGSNHLDSFEVSPDFDGDSLPDCTDSDDDGDLWSDIQESICGTNSFSAADNCTAANNTMGMTISCSAFDNSQQGQPGGDFGDQDDTCDSDGDGITDDNEALCSDFATLQLGLAAANNSNQTPTDSDGDGVPNCIDVDDDNDWYSDTLENNATTCANGNPTDGNVFCDFIQPDVEPFQDGAPEGDAFGSFNEFDDEGPGTGGPQSEDDFGSGSGGQGFGGFDCFSSGFVNSTGGFTIDSLTQGTYELGIMVNPEFDSPVASFNQRNIFLTDGQSVSYTFNLTQASSLSGYVNYSSNNSGVPRVHIDVFNPAGGGFGFAQTNDNGYYSISGLSEGVYQIFVNPPFDFATGQPVGGLTQVQDQVTIGSGANTKNFNMSTGGGFQGYVFNETAGAVERAFINMFSPETFSFGFAETQSDGSYSISGLATGSYEIFIHPPFEGFFGAGAPPKPPIETLGFAISDVTIQRNFSFGAGKRIFGRVVDGADNTTAVPDVFVGSHLKQRFSTAAAVDRQDSDGDGASDEAEFKCINQTAVFDSNINPSNTVSSEKTTDVASCVDNVRRKEKGKGGPGHGPGAGEFAGSVTDTNGDFSLTGLVFDGVYEIFVDTFFAQGSFASEATTVTLNGDSVEINFSLSSPRSIYGWVTDSDGNPVSNAFVNAWVPVTDKDGAPPSFGFDITGSDGSYNLTGLQGGNTYNLFVQPRDPGKSGRMVPGISLPGGSDVVQNVSLASGGSVTGRVLDPNGDPLAGASVDIFNEELGGFSHTVTNPDGRFTLRGLQTGTGYTLVVFPFNFPPQEFDGISITSGETTDIGDVQLSSGKSITGIISSRGAVQQSAEVEVWSNEVFGFGRDTTDSSGNYTIEGLPQGTYDMFVRLSTGEQKMFFDINITDDPTIYNASLFSAAENPANLTVQVINGSSGAGIVNASVDIFNPTAGFGENQLTNSTGYAVFTSLPVADGYGWGARAEMFRPDYFESNSSNNKSFNLSSGDWASMTINLTEILLSSTFDLNGSVTGTNRTVTIIAVDINDPTNNDFATSNGGVYEILDLQAGNYTLTAISAGVVKGEVNITGTGGGTVEQDFAIS